MESEKSRHSKRGMALVITVIMITVVVGAVLLVSRQAVSAKIHTDAAHNQYQIEEACKAGIDHAVQRLCNQYVVDNDNKVGNYASYSSYLDHLVACDSTLTLASPSDPIVLDANRGISVTKLTVARAANSINGFNFTIESTAKLGRKSRTARQTMNVGGSPFTGFEYAALANNINCILCHAEFRNVDMDNNTTKSLYGTFDRVKVASLMNLLYRSHAYNGASDLADSRVAGTVYTRGKVINSYSDDEILDTAVSTGSLSAYMFDINGHIIQNPTTGALTTGQLTVVKDKDSNGAPLPGGNMYKNYPTDVKLMTDGVLPATFPAPYPDAPPEGNSDKVVQDSEFTVISKVLSGTLTGGVACGVATGSTYTGTTFPTTSTKDAAEALAKDGKYEGNLILTGTASNPVQLNGQIAISGDLLLRGVVKGTGQLFVKGNTYIAGNVTYADGATFGKATDGTENALAIITGGNVIVGDYLTIRGKNHSKDTTSTTPSATASGSVTSTPAYTTGVGSGQLSIQTRARTQTIAKVANPKNSKDAKESLQIGYFDPDVTDGNGIVAARKGSQQASFTQSELMIFNNMEMTKAVDDPTYTPRFYGLDSNAPDKIYFYDNPDSEHAIRYDEGAATAGGTSETVLSLEDYIITKGYADKNIASRAARLYLNPTGGWLSDTVLRQMWWDDEQSRTTANSIYKIDALLYCNNAIFCITRSKVRHGSNTEGKMRVRGAIICPDIGVLAAGNAGTVSGGNTSFLLEYDKRVRNFWSPQDRSQVTFRRQVYELLPETETEANG